MNVRVAMLHAIPTVEVLALLDVVTLVVVCVRVIVQMDVGGIAMDVLRLVLLVVILPAPMDVLVVRVVVTVHVIINAKTIVTDVIAIVMENVPVAIALVQILVWVIVSLNVMVAQQLA
jgi:hypothetical protein